MAENRELALVLKLVADEFKSELKNSQGALSQFNDFIKDWKTQLAAAGTALFALAKSTADFGEEMLKGAQKAGTTVQSFSALAHAAKMADVEQQTLINGLKALSVNMAEASRGNKDAADLFARLGVSAVDATGKLRPIEAVLLDLADVFASSADGAAKNEVSVKLFAKAWEAFLPFLNQGKEAIRAQEAEAVKLGRTLSEHDAKAADEFNLELKKLEASMKGLVTNAGRPLLVSLTELVKLMKEITSGPVGGAVSSTFGVIGEHMLGLTQAAKEFGAVWKFAFGSGKDGLSLDQLKNELARIEKEWTIRLFKLQHPQAAALLDHSPGSEAPAPKKDLGTQVFMGAMVGAKDQEKLGKAKLEIFLMQNRALEIQEKLAREAAQGESEFFLAFDRQQQFQREDEAEQVRRGQAIVQQTQLEVRIREAAQQRERAGLVENAQAWIAYDNQVGASTDQRYTHQMDLLRATLTKETQLRQDEAARLLIAWQNNDQQLAADVLGRANLTATERETIERQYLTRLAGVHQEFSGSIFEGWKRGLDSYVRNTDSAFGFAAQMAQRTAQFMEQSFRTFFFDLMDGRIKSMKDLFKSFGDFVKQVIAQIMAQLATMVALKAITGGFGGFGLGGFFGGGGGGGADAGGLLGGLKFNAGGIVPQRFASGGAVLGTGNRDTVAALLTPGEGVLNRRGMATLDRLNAGVTPTREPSVTINFLGFSAEDRPKINYRRQFESMVVDVIARNPDLRGMLGAR